MLKPSLTSNLIQRWQLIKSSLCQLLSLDLSLAEHSVLAEFPSNNSGVSEAGPGVAPIHRGPRRSVAGGPSIRLEAASEARWGWLLKRKTGARTRLEPAPPPGLQARVPPLSPPAPTHPRAYAGFSL